MSSLLTKPLEKPSPGDIVSVHTRHYVVACPPAMLWQWKDEMETLEKHEDPNQPRLFDLDAKDEKRQLEDNMRYWRKWLDGVDVELEREPARIRDFYEVKTTRIEPVGMVYLWPQS